MNIWGQIGVILGVANTVMLIGVFYTTTASHAGISPLLYLLLVMVLLALVLAFVQKVGIRGYYQFFNENSALSQVAADTKAIREYLTPPNSRASFDGRESVIAEIKSICNSCKCAREFGECMTDWLLEQTKVQEPKEVKR